MSYKNSEGYSDPTAGVAMGSANKQEQEIDKLNHKVMQSFRLLLDLAGFEIVGRVTLRHKKSGREKDGETVSEERWEVQEAWDKQNNFLKAQARAQAELSRMIKQYDEMLHANWELATEEQKTRIQSMKAKAQLNDVEETADDGFLEALNSSATEDWNDEETGI